MHVQEAIESELSDGLSTYIYGRSGSGNISINTALKLYIINVYLIQENSGVTRHEGSTVAKKAEQKVEDQK